jgi:DNA adenine methylase
MVRMWQAKRIYACEMTNQDHIELLELLLKHPGPVMISGYDNEIYNDILQGWHTERRVAQCEGGCKRTEVLWMNYEREKKQLNFYSAMDEAW